jgi:hypothetical protein
MRYHRLFELILAGMLGLALTGCGGASRPDPNEIQGEVFIPPTPGVTATPFIATPSASPLATELLRPSPTPACLDSLTYLEDLSIPDGTLVAPGESLDKRWLVENTGTCNWEQGYSLKLVAGPDLGVSETQDLYPARSGSSATIRMIFTAPDEPNTYRSAWQAYNPQGEAFGDPIFIEVTVGNP